MNIKIQGGGGGKAANKGSCSAIISYLDHEDMERAIEGKDVEPLFNNDYNKISSKEVIYKIDHNKGQLHKNDSKFFVITVSPSQEELNTMGKTPKERSEALRNYIRSDVMQKYAENFNKNLNKEKIMYYAKIHHDRGDKLGLNMHCHIVVSRKDIDNKIKLSPKTNHKNTKKGAVKGGFNRESFVQSCETAFDKTFNYFRSHENSFEYLNTMKNGSIEDIKLQAQKSVTVQKEQTKDKNVNKSLNKGGLEL